MGAGGVEGEAVVDDRAGEPAEARPFLDDLNVVALGTFEGNLWAGESKATMGIYMDERADEPQRGFNIGFDYKLLFAGSGLPGFYLGWYF